MYLNRVILIGQIVTEPRLREATGESKTAMLDFRLRVLRRQWKREQMTIRIVVFGAGAVAFDQHKKKDDFVVTSGRLCQRTFTGREGTTIEHHYVVAEEFRFLYGPPGKFVKGHVVVSRDVWERWRALEEEIDPFYIPKKLRKSDAGGSDTPWSDGDPTDNPLHEEWLRELDQPPDASGSGAWGYDPDRERGRGV